METFAARLRFSLLGDGTDLNTLLDNEKTYKISKRLFKYSCSTIPSDSDFKDSLRNLIVLRNLSCWKFGNNITFDELVLPYISERESLTAFMERKPHPLGTSLTFSPFFNHSQLFFKGSSSTWLRCFLSVIDFPLLSIFFPWISNRNSPVRRHSLST